MGSFFVLGGSILATWYLAMAYESTELMLLVYLQAALFVLSFFMVWYRKFTLRAELLAPVDIAEPGKETMVKLVTKNKGLLPIARADAQIVVTDVCTGHRKKEWMKLSTVPRGEWSFVRQIAFSGTGTYRLQLRKLRVYDLTGLFYGKIRRKSSVQIRVLPKLCEIPVRLGLAVTNFYGEADVYDEHEAGYDNSEIFDVREYQKGDRLQNIHWKLTAKQEELMVKEHSLPKACPVVLLLDYHGKKRRKSSLRGQKPEKREVPRLPMMTYLEIAASLSFSMMDAGCPHYVAWYDEETLDMVRQRVDDEESLFFFLGRLMQIRFAQPKEGLLLCYEKKYRSEPYVWRLTLDEKLVLKKEAETVAEFSEKNPEQSMTQVELIL